MIRRCDIGMEAAPPVQAGDLWVLVEDDGPLLLTMKAGTFSSAGPQLLPHGETPVWHTVPDRGRALACMHPGSDRVSVARRLGFDVLRAQQISLYVGDMLSMEDVQSELRREGVDLDAHAAKVRVLIDDAKSRRSR